MNRSYRLIFPLFITALLFCHPPMTGTAVAKEEAPIRVEADHMSSMETESSVIFTGDVDARQEDVRIRSDKMTVFYTQKAKNSDEAKINQKVEKLTCNGNVEITRGEWLGTSERMIYLSKERQFILIGDAKAWQGQNVVSGDKIIYYLDEGRSEVVAERATAKAGKSGENQKKPGRVNMTILQD